MEPNRKRPIDEKLVYKGGFGKEEKGGVSSKWYWDNQLNI